ncbi:prolyl aminopeptidase [Shewanella woodyi]|uniref:prolyl aminopeptidase n=1 Tax=Shewanella woodyi TaxID=60961 RepID=UPI003749AF98
MRLLYPDIEPYADQLLSMPAKKGEVVHQLYVEECGNPEGVPIVFLHGGPGSGCRASHRCYFNPKLYRIILLDQRGCGRSKPYACLENNNTDYLIDDLEQIRDRLNIDKWVVFGGSWGATLALVYAEHYPERVQAMILRGVFLGRQQDIDWVYSDGGAANVFPEAWKQLMSVLTDDEQLMPLKSLYALLVGTDDVRRSRALQAFNQWEQQIVTLREGSFSLTKTLSEILPEVMFSEPYEGAAAIIQLYYSMKLCFIEHKPILSSIDKIRQIPTYIVHGRYDMVCPLKQAWTLSQAWPEARLTVLPLAGHSAGEASMVDALVELTDSVGSDLSANSF